MTDMPVIEQYRGVGIFDFQDRQRIEAVVRPDIDAALALTDTAALVAFCGNASRSPEARLAAADRFIAVQQLAAEKHQAAVVGDVSAAIAGLDSLDWADPATHGSLLDARGAPPRPAEHAARLEAAQALAADRQRRYRARLSDP